MRVLGNLHINAAGATFLTPLWSRPGPMHKKAAPTATRHRKRTLGRDSPPGRCGYGPQMENLVTGASSSREPLKAKNQNLRNGPTDNRKNRPASPPPRIRAVSTGEETTDPQRNASKEARLPARRPFSFPGTEPKSCVPITYPEFRRRKRRLPPRVTTS